MHCENTQYIICCEGLLEELMLESQDIANCGSCSSEIYGKCMGTKKSFKFELNEMNTQMEHLSIRMVLYEDLEAVAILEIGYSFMQGIKSHYKSELYKCTLCKSK